jgi:antitoxin component YwqK of YwqJK toxin-antitoxin module
MNKLILIPFLTLSFNWAFSQVDYEKQMPHSVKFDRSIIDTVYGIQHYEPFNSMLSGDSIRMCGTYACQNQVKDFYVTGELLHAGFYTDGQLKSYKNYFPNGNVERDFRSLDLYRSQAKIFFENGQLKSQIKYNEGEPQEWTDYYENGQIEMTEEKTKSCTYHVFLRTFYSDGKPRKALELSDKKKLVYSFKEYFASGQLSMDGSKMYNEELGDYINVGIWKYYSESGSLIKEEKFDNGTLVKN